MAIAICLPGASAMAQGAVHGIVRDETGAGLPGVTVVLRTQAGAQYQTVTDAQGAYRVERVPDGRYQLELSLVNFATLRREVRVNASRGSSFDAVLQLSLSADVTVTGKSTFTNLADVTRPAENLVGIAQSASQGAITARQLDTRPRMRTGEVLETIPGVVISQHSGEGKANQYYLRGFNLDHGTDFATTVAGMPVNMPTHAHGHGYSDLNFLIPELVSGVQFSKGPYFAEQGDFATAGSANINYAAALDHPIVRVAGGGQGFERVLAGGSQHVRSGVFLAALEVEHNDGPWARGEDFQKINGVVRYSRGDTLSGVSLTGMGYRSRWNSTDQVPQRALQQGIIGRFGSLDPSDGGDTYRYSASLDWQRMGTHTSTKATAYGIAYNLNLFSNFTFFLDDPVRGDQFQQAGRRFITGGKLTHRRLERWGGRAVQNTFGVQVRNDDITTLGLFHTQARQLLNVIREDAVLQTSGAVYAQNEIQWTSWLRTLAGVRADAYRFRVDASDPANGGLAHAGLVSPKGGLILGPFRGTEFYANAGVGFHSNDARGATITRDPSTGQGADPVTPLVRARGAEIGVRTVAVSHLQASATVWSLGLDSELVFAGDAGTTQPGRPSHRYGVELANYYSPTQWLTFDADISTSRAHFTDRGRAGEEIPGAARTVVSGGATVDSVRNFFGSLRVRYFGPRPLVEDGSATSAATSLLNTGLGYKIARHTKIGVELFNLLNAADSDVDYYYASRLPGEPTGGVTDVHLHPAVPRTARVTLTHSF